MRPSLLSRIVLAGVCSAAAAGWFGVRLGPSAAGPTLLAAGLERPAESGQGAPQPGVRNRAAWQPSPVPSQGAQEAQGAAPVNPAPQSLAPAPAVGGAVAASARPVPAPPAPNTRAGTAGPAGPSGTAVPGASGARVPYVPLAESFTTDRLEALFDGGLPEAQGEWREVSFFSRALDRDVPYMVWLPPGYASDDRTYPTLYLLHGVGGAAGFGVEEWLGYALTEDLDRMLAAGLIEPMIVVLPNGEQGYWMNHADGGPRWADFVAVDLVKNVDATFRTQPERERRAVGGLSMGGHGALQLAMNHPDVFAISGAHSPTLRPFEDTPEFFGDQKWFARFDPLTLAKSSDAVRQIAFWIDVGSQDDKWGEGAAAVARALEAKRAPVTFRVLEGEHEGWYWEYYLPEYLNFYSQALSAPARTAQGAPAVAYHPIGTSVSSAAALGVPMAQAGPASN